MKCLVQVNGNVVYDGKDGPAVYATKEDVLNIAAVRGVVGEREVKRIVTVPNKLINIIARFKKQYEY